MEKQPKRVRLFFRLKQPLSPSQVRALGYKQSSKKEPSASSLYELVNFDFVRSPCHVSHVASLVQVRREGEREGGREGAREGGREQL